MPFFQNKSLPIVVLALLLAVPGLAQAHKFWLLPSSTVLSGEDHWITVDAARSNAMFIFNHSGMGLEGLQVHAPGGGTVEPANVHEMELRSVFDVRIEQEGTYKLALVDDYLSGHYELDGERKRWFGTADQVGSDIPEAAEDVRIAQRHNRAETFVTAGAPSRDVLEPTDRGLEMVPKTHPNDLYAGEAARFRFLLDGEPAENLEVTVIPGGVRYRNDPDKMQVTTNAEGIVELTWPHPGMYYLEASASDQKTGTDQADQRRLTYVATLEVLPF